MRRIALLVAVGLLATAATAWAVTNTVSYSVTIKKAGKGKPSKKNPINIGYAAKLHIDSDPSGSQPNTAPVTSIYFPSQIKQNAALIPSCSPKQIDGQQPFPAKCNKAKIGSGTANALAGTPGQPDGEAITENLNVTFVSGGSKQILLVLNSAPNAPVAITNRVVPGDLAAGGGKFGYRVDFKIPPDLQEPVAGIKVALVDFNVNLPPKVFTVKVHGKPTKLSYLQETGCPAGGLPTRAVGHFVDENNNPSADVTNDSTFKC